MPLLLQPLGARKVIDYGEEERSIVQFGTGGWRAVIGEGFTLPMLRIFAEADTAEKARELVDWLKQYAREDGRRRTADSGR